MIINGCGTKLPAVVTFNIVSYLSDQDVFSFRLACKGHNEFYKNHKQKIDFSLFIKKIETKTYFDWYVYENLKDNPQYKDPIVALIHRGVVQTTSAGYPLLQDCIGLHQKFLDMNESIDKNMVRKEISLDFCCEILKIKNSKVYVLGTPYLKEINIENGEVKSFEDPFHFNVYKFDKNKDFLYAVDSASKSIRSWDLATLKCHKVFMINKSSAESLLLDDKHLYAGCSNGRIKVFNIETMEMIVNYKDNEGKKPIERLSHFNSYIVSHSDSVRFYKFAINNLVSIQEVKCSRLTCRSMYRTGSKIIQGKFILSQTVDNKIAISDVSDINNISMMILDKNIDDYTCVRLFNEKLFVLSDCHLNKTPLAIWNMKKVCPEEPPTWIETRKTTSSLFEEKGFDKFCPEWIFRRDRIRFANGSIILFKNNRNISKLVVFTPK